MQRALCNEGIEISEYKVRRIMRENGFYPETRTKYKPTHNGKTDGKYHKNLLQQNFKTEKKNQVWVGDITYIKTQIGWVYLAVVMDLYNREVIGYHKMLKEHNITGSMSRPGCPYDNSCMESFFATLKKERIYRREYDTMEDVQRDMFRYIELFYNRKRLHSVLGYMSPVSHRLEYDRMNVA